MKGKNNIKFAGNLRGQMWGERKSIYKRRTFGGVSKNGGNLRAGKNGTSLIVQCSVLGRD